MRRFDLWKGYGLLGVFIPLIVLGLMQLLVNAIFRDAYFYTNHPGLNLITGAIAAVFVWFVGRYLNSRPPKLVYDPKTNKQKEVKPVHSLFFLKLEYWAVIVGVSGIIYSLPE